MKLFSKVIYFLKNKPLVFKISASVLLCVAFGILFLSLFVSNYSKPLLKDQVIANAYKAIGEVNYDVAQGAGIVEQSIVNTAKILSSDTRLDESKLIKLSNAALSSIEEQYGYFYEFWIYVKNKAKAKGVLYYSCIKNGKITTVAWEEQDFIKDREWLKIPMKTGKMNWSEPYMSQKPEGDAILAATVSMPFKFKDSKNWDGIIAASGNIDELRKRVSSTKFPADGKFLLLSPKGLYMVHPNPEIEMKKTIFDLAKEYNLKQLKQTGIDLREGQSGFVVMENSSVFDNKDVVFVYMPIAKTNWGSCLVFASENFYQPVKHFQWIIVMATIVGLLGLILLINWICTYTTSPLTKLANIADKYGRGEFDVELPPVNSQDEVGVLTQAFYNMRDNLLNLIHIQKENAKEEQKRNSELEIAARIQHAALPLEFPINQHFNMAASMDAAKEVGGDFYDFFFVDDKHFAVLIADVSGKGVPAALFMMNAKALLKNNIMSGCLLSEAVERTNKALCSANDARMFVTAFVAILNIETGELEFVNAGHNPPLIKQEGNYEYLNADTNLVLGAIDSMKYNSSSIILKPDNGIFMYTDGIVEAKNDKEEFYSENRLVDCLNKNISKEAKDILSTVKNDVAGFCSNVDQYDDMTMLSLIYFG